MSKVLISILRVFSLLVTFALLNATAQEIKSNKKLGQHPCGSLIKAQNGHFYGMTSTGGDYNLGVFFEYDLDLNIYKKIIDFDGKGAGSKPEGSLVLASNGKLYGLTKYGGEHDKGVLFEYCINSGTFSKKIDFDGNNGRFPVGSLIEANDSNLYGIAEGIGVIYDTGVFYKQSGIFKYDIINESITIQYNFCNAIYGENPATSLIQASNGKLYGVTRGGGLYGKGVIYEYDIEKEKYSKKYDFNKNMIGFFPENQLLEINGNLYGTTGMGSFRKRGAIYEYKFQDNSIKRICYLTKKRGFVIKGQLLYIGSTIYGTTLYGGRNDYSRIISYNLITKKFKIEYEFKPSLKGFTSLGSLIMVGNLFYGMTYYGGKNGKGVIFCYDPKSGEEEVKFNFK